ncbi:MAG: PQQ-like beta-propeller repeat protein [Verrucomicrobiales bacterium]|nr:PQQ-like beta-propeller repeat protein [Verrucomicrobiales bacterium]
MNLLRTILALPLLILVWTPVQADWNQWRGPERTGEIFSETPWPDSLKGEHLTRIWKAALAEGYSSPVTDGELVFTVATRDETSEVAKAFHLETGELVWEKSWEGSMKVPFFAKKNGSWVRSTPAVHDGAIYIGGMRDVLVKLNAKTGGELWRVDFTQREETEVPAFGQVCSPLIDGNDLYVQAGLAVVKLDAETGETIWRSMEDERAMFGSAFSSPILATIAGKQQLLIQARLELAGLDPETGKVLWNTPVKAFRGMNILTPTAIGENKIFTASYGGGAFLFSVQAKDDGSFSVKQKWNNETAEGYMGSPVVAGDHIYLHGRDKKFHCLALSSGEIVWSSEEEFGEYWSMIYQGDQVLALDQKGELLLFQARPDTFTITDRRMVSPKDSTWAHLGIAGDKLFVRSLKGISVWQWK